MDTTVLASWTLTDTLIPESIRPNEAETEISNSVQLESLLVAFSKERPRVLLLESSYGRFYYIAIGGEWAGVEYYVSSTTERPTCLSHKLASADADRYFTGEGQPSCFTGRCLMPVQELIQAIVSIFKSEPLSDSVHWEIFV